MGARIIFFFFANLIVGPAAGDIKRGRRAPYTYKITQEEVARQEKHAENESGYEIPSTQRRCR